MTDMAATTEQGDGGLKVMWANGRSLYSSKIRPVRFSDTHVFTMIAMAGIACTGVRRPLM
jgi:hypothetical protein